MITYAIQLIIHVTVIIPTYYNIANTISHYYYNLIFSSENLLISKNK